jgi:putative endonuclease
MSYWVYIITNRPHGTLYVGVTNNVRRRIWEHRTGALAGFSKRYGLKRLVYLEQFRDITAAIEREKQIKGWLRRGKIELIHKANPLWQDLSERWYDEDAGDDDRPNSRPLGR